jgi:hypothetical protein
MLKIKMNDFYYFLILLSPPVIVFVFELIRTQTIKILNLLY